jgi:hypothetical protein
VRFSFPGMQTGTKHRAEKNDSSLSDLTADRDGYAGELGDAFGWQALKRGGHTEMADEPAQGPDVFDICILVYNRRLSLDTKHIAQQPQLSSDLFGRRKRQAGFENEPHACPDFFSQFDGGLKRELPNGGKNHYSSRDLVEDRPAALEQEPEAIRRFLG